MGHISNPEREYRLLQQRLDRNVTGAPQSPTFTKILQLLFSPDEAEIARRIPSQPIPLDTISKKLNIPFDELSDKMTDMAQRGLVIDMERNGRRYVALPPVIIGFFEYTFMRTRENAPMMELAQLFDDYMTQDDRFARSVFTSQTQLGRSLVREESLPEGDYTEILDWERASQIVQSASTLGVSLCACRHKKSHLGKACDRPQKTCLTLNYGAEVMIRSGLADRITAAEGIGILEECKEAGMAQTGDNVQRKMTYICNCCGCCCGMMEAINTCNIRNAIVSSNWIMQVDLAKCKGCGKCAQVCPVGAIAIAEEKEGEKKRRWAVRDADLCLGCGVCCSSCEFGGASMQPREKRVLTPETLFDRVATMAIERGKLAHLIFNNHDKLSHRAMSRIVGVIEKSPPFKAAMAIEPLKSTFLNNVVKGANRKAKQVREEVT
ncbi:MAG: 4Fe-4S dicluster domain-containing protein [Chloroflexi bacterium]|nr:4Fe-4S dicluster domain-containing protein [Chloroflexota bacterium]